MYSVTDISGNTVEPLQTGTPENRKPLETERFCQSQISVFTPLNRKPL